MNQALILGRLGKDVELSYTPSGRACARFSVAVSEHYKDEQGNKKEKTEWLQICCWNKLAELCNQFIGKGSQVFVEGKITTRSWEDKQGQKKYVTEIIANNIQFLTTKANANRSADDV